MPIHDKHNIEVHSIGCEYNYEKCEQASWFHYFLWTSQSESCLEKLSPGWIPARNETLYLVSFICIFKFLKSFFIFFKFAIQKKHHIDNGKLDFFHIMKVLFPAYFRHISKTYHGKHFHIMELDKTMEIGFSNLFL